jgi:hypothetical protein
MIELELCLSPFPCAIDKDAVCAVSHVEVGDGTRLQSPFFNPTILEYHMRSNESARLQMLGIFGTGVASIQGQVRAHKSLDCQASARPPHAIACNLDDDEIWSYAQS